MKKLKPNTQVHLTNGQTAKVKSLLGEGGQGAVYQVAVDGKDYAMKIYTKKPKKNFVDNLEENIRKGSPTPHFLWMKWMVKTPALIGYVMDLRPKDYVDFSKFLMAKARFSSWSAMTNAALQITYAFRELHRKGLSYQDLNDGNFFFNPKTGDVLICDNDNVAPADTNLGIKGKCRYMAPEVVMGKSNPNNLSDYFSLSVVLFMLFFNNHPFDGKRVSSVPCMNDAIEREVYGINPIFIYSPTDDRNRPVRGVHQNVINRWGLFPKFFQDAFVKAFSNDLIHDKNKRMSDNEWVGIISQLRSQTIQHTCGYETFIDLAAPKATCFNCGKEVTMPLILKIGSHRTIIYPQMKIYANQVSSSADMFQEVGEVVVNKNNPNVWGVSNHSKDSWRVTLPNGQKLDVPQGKGFPIYKDEQIEFSAGKIGKIE